MRAGITRNCIGEAQGGWEGAAGKVEKKWKKPSQHTVGRFSDSPLFALSEAVTCLNMADLWATKQKETGGKGQE